MEISAARKYNISFNTICMRQAVMDILHFKTSKQQALKDNLVSQADWDYFTKHISIEELDLKTTDYTLPDDLDDELVLARIPSLKMINTQSPLGLLIENCLLNNVFSVHNNTVRKCYLDFIMGRITELQLADKVSDLFASLGVAFKRIVNYVEKHHKAILEAVKTGKPESKEIKQDIEYLNIIQSIK